MTKSSRSRLEEVEVFLCRASGEGSHNFRVCTTEEQVFAFYKEMFGEDQGGGIQSQIDHFHDADNWSNGGTAYACPLYCALYCATFEVWKVDDRELSVTRSESATHNAAPQAQALPQGTNVQPAGAAPSRGDKPHNWPASTDGDVAVWVSDTYGISYHDEDDKAGLAKVGRVLLSHVAQRSGCPCTVEGIEPCSYACSCAHPVMSGGCQRCAAYGSLEQRQSAARRLAESATAPSEALSALIALEQAYSNKHSPQHRAACLAQAQAVIAKVTHD